MDVSRLGGAAGEFLIGLTKNGSKVIDAVKGGTKVIVEKPAGGILNAIKNVAGAILNNMTNNLTYIANNPGKFALAVTGGVVAGVALGFAVKFLNSKYKAYKASKEENEKVEFPVIGTHTVNNQHNTIDTDAFSDDNDNDNNNNNN